MSPARNSNIRQIWIKMYSYIILKNADGKSALRMSNGISTGPCRGMSRIYSIQIQVIEWAKLKFSTIIQIILNLQEKISWLRTSKDLKRTWRKRIIP